VATNLHNARLNFVFQLAAITPTYTAIPGTFFVVDRIKRGINPEDPKTFGNSTGYARAFTIRRLGSNADTEPLDMVRRYAPHEFELVVAYPTAIGLEPEVHEMMDLDRHDMIGELTAYGSSDSNVVGIPADAAAATGIVSRRRENDRLVDTDGAGVWLQVYRWVCKIKEER
jgi:hypothetical protein